MRRALLLTVLAGSLSIAGGAGCGGSAALRAAEAGRIDELRRALHDELGRGDLDGDEARAIAVAVASVEVARAAPPDGAERLRELRSCARHLERDLVDRARGTDAIAAAAAMILLDAGLANAEILQRHAAHTEASAPPMLANAFRAVHTRSLTRRVNSAVRRRRLLDGDQDVRVAALRAAIVAADPSDRDALLEAARLDPHPLARTLAIRAAAVVGGEVVVLALRDLWVFADEPVREGIAEAWAAPRAAHAGGYEQLLWAATTQRGAPAIAASLALARARAPGASEALGVLSRAVASGLTRDRVYAIQASPLDDASLRAAVAAARDDPDEAVALAALSRQVEPPPAGMFSPVERAAAAARLLKVASGDSTRALLAKSALARAGVRDVVPLLSRDVASPDERRREVASVALAELGELPRAALLLADAAPRVRASAACAILDAH